MSKLITMYVKVNYLFSAETFAMTSKKRGRALGSREALCYHVGKKLSAWFIGVIQTSTFIQDDVFRETFKIITRKQEMLQMRIVPTLNEHGDVIDLQFQLREDPEDIDFEVVSLRSKDDWPVVVARENTTKQWDTANGPLCRFILGRVAKEPGVCTEEPGVHDEEPGVCTEEPGVHDEEPGVHDEVPGVCTEEPGVHDEVPGVCTEEPGVHDEEPGVCTEEPGVHDEEPGVCTEEPGVHDEVPGVCTEEPGVHDDEPGVCTEEPGVHDEEPGVCTEEPVHVEEPGVYNVEPGFHDEEPGVCSEEPGVQIVHYQYEYVIFLKCHHSLTDGASSFSNVNHLIIPTLSALMNGNPIEGELPFCPLTKSVEELFLDQSRLKDPVPWIVRKMIDVYRWFNRNFRSEPQSLFKFPDENLSLDDNQDSESRYIQKIFNKELCNAVISSAKRNGVSVHSVLLFVGVLAFSRTAKAASVDIPPSLQQVWPVNLRKFLNNETLQPLGFITNTCVTQHSTIVECTREQFWEHCKKVLSSVKWQARRQKIFYGLRLSKYFLDAVQSSSTQTVLSELGYEPWLHLTNFGTIQPSMATRGNGSTAIKLTEQFAFASGSQERTLISLLQYLLTYEGKFHCVFYRTPDTSKRYMETYVQNFEDVLSSYCAP